MIAVVRCRADDHGALVRSLGFVRRPELDPIGRVRVVRIHHRVPDVPVTVLVSRGVLDRGVVARARKPVRLKGIPVIHARFPGMIVRDAVAPRRVHFRSGDGLRRFVADCCDGFAADEPRFAVAAQVRGRGRLGQIVLVHRVLGARAVEVRAARRRRPRRSRPGDADAGPVAGEQERDVRDVAPDVDGAAEPRERAVARRLKHEDASVRRRDRDSAAVVGRRERVREVEAARAAAEDVPVPRETLREDDAVDPQEVRRYPGGDVIPVTVRLRRRGDVRRDDAAVAQQTAFAAAARERVV